MRPTPIPPAAGQESVWDYPRPPRVEPTSKRVRVVFNGTVIADTTKALRVLETSHPPCYYLPPDAFLEGVLRHAHRTSFCEFKGMARYYDVVVGDKVAPAAAWYDPDPLPGYEAIRDYVAVYAGMMDECTVDGERVAPQPGGFYGGWITSDVVGPFKGEPGSADW
ncbi:MAG: DUF427 domain-containing protein [Dehalococcoidia bacterium]|nr:DUF427 domain-containing protein [Dehalococcoidia bacterium]